MNQQTLRKMKVDEFISQQRHQFGYENLKFLRQHDSGIHPELRTGEEDWTIISDLMRGLRNMEFDTGLEDIIDDLGLEG